jgi:hypothetical protein
MCFGEPILIFEKFDSSDSKTTIRKSIWFPVKVIQLISKQKRDLKCAQKDAGKSKVKKTNLNAIRNLYYKMKGLLPNLRHVFDY